VTVSRGITYFYRLLGSHAGRPMEKQNSHGLDLSWAVVPGKKKKKNKLGFSL